MVSLIAHLQTMESVMPLHLASNAVATVLEWLAAYGESR
jgi:hypothetical protein